MVEINDWRKSPGGHARGGSGSLPDIKAVRQQLIEAFTRGDMADYHDALAKLREWLERKNKRVGRFSGSG